ncbi:DNA primase [Acidihalobacter ferrooxydans]|uniref:DNA primase n=1 Tax=Acidihalobacter ferrooxydans TaxID=1765967 RepID=A0A1P8UKF1_9GAMM|nr:DNA primase [Acidihalobacter ferrooxydans]APZ44326.1 DNA primase [Acidihalobacter ferrooxydans]
MSLIPQHFIDDLIAQTDIVEIINARVPLKRSGHEYKACCPFHDEKTPSFYVSPQKQFYHCFGCGAHGTALGFLMDYDHLDFVEAIELLAGQLGLDVPREGGHDSAERARHDDSRAPLYAALEAADQWYRTQLAQQPQAIDYLKQRGLDGETAKRFGLGYAPAGWSGLLTALSAHHPREHLEQAGLLARKNDSVYDRFRDRIMFPIRDSRGRTIGFGGRVLGDGTPKYLNSSETALFHKGRELYGLFEARQSRAPLDTILIVEGYMDVIGLAQSGIVNAVATLGTATTREHLQRLFRVVDRLVFCFDGDRAGRQAAWRALEHALPVMTDGREAAFLFLPDGEDPDSFIRRHGKEAFAQRQQHATALSRFLLDELSQRHTGNSMEARAALLKEAGMPLRELDPGALKNQIIDAIALETRMSPERVTQALRRASTPATDNSEPLMPDRHQNVRRTPIRTAIALLLTHPHLGAQLHNGNPIPHDDSLPGLALLHTLLEIVRENPNITTAALLERWRGKPEQPHLARLLEWTDLHGDETLARQVFTDALARTHEQHISQRLDTLLTQARRHTLDAAQKQELNDLLTRSRTLNADNAR